MSSIGKTTAYLGRRISGRRKSGKWERLRNQDGRSITGFSRSRDRIRAVERLENPDAVPVARRDPVKPLGMAAGRVGADTPDAGVRWREVT
jgi:hypothetical protein